MTVFVLMLPAIYGQTPTTTVQGTSTGNLEFKEQEAYIVTELPEGVLAQNSQMGTGNELTNLIVGIAGSTGAMGILNALYTKVTGKKNEEKTQEVKATTQQVAANQTKIVDVQQGSLKLQYDNMPDKGESITNRPEIKLKAVEDLKDQTLKTAAKA